MENFEYVKKELIQLAKENDICIERYREMINCNCLDELLNMYIECIDFCFSNNYPNNTFINKYLKGNMEHKGFFLNDNIELANVSNIVALGDCNIVYKSSGYNVCQLFIKDNSKVNLNTYDLSSVTIDLFDNAELLINSFGESKILVNIYGDSKANYTSNEKGFVKIVYKNKKTY